MLKPPDHQVAGHFATSGELGPLTDSSGLFYKPFQSTDRGTSELSFYSSLSSSSSSSVPLHFFPSFHGTATLPPSDHPHLILSDLTFPLSSPSIIDFKIGARTWAPQHPLPYFQKCIQKDRESTSLALGFRVSGLQIYRSKELFYKPSRPEVKGLGKEGVRRVLREFFVDLAVAREVLESLGELKRWFEEQTMWHFYSTSVLVMYEGEEVRVKLVDFAHVVDGDGVIDHNFLGGLCSLIKFVKEVVEEGTTDGGKGVENGGVEETN